MTGADARPLLILDRAGKGRVAQLASDQIWLWSRGYEGGGPYAELLRRTVHWLMKEPELDEKALEIKTDKSEIFIRTMNQQASPLRMTKPDGKTEDVQLDASTDQYLQKTISADEHGIYMFETPDGTRQSVAIGEINAPEFQSVITTPEPMDALLQSSGGGAIWLSETPNPTIKLLPRGTHYAGASWIGLRQNGDYSVKSVNDTPLLPPWISALLLVGIASFMWWREGR
jgi:hypothetical protein